MFWSGTRKLQGGCSRVGWRGSSHTCKFYLPEFSAKVGEEFPPVPTRGSRNVDISILGGLPSKFILPFYQVLNSAWVLPLLSQ